jgi:hypothetical protein
MATKERNTSQTLPVASEETVYLDIIFLNMYKPIRGILKTNNCYILQFGELSIISVYVSVWDG